MSRSHSRSGPGGTAGARDGAGGLEAAAAAAAAQRAGVEGELAQPGELLDGDPMPMQPGREYVDSSDHQRVVDVLTAERDEMRTDLQRVAADFENYKRRAALQREQASAAAETRLLGELLTVIDDTERAMDHAASAETAVSPALEGLRTVHGRLSSVVQSHGLERISAAPGATFDPNLHEAMMVQPAPAGEPDDTILQELQSGWMHGQRVLRHARVIVAGGA